MCIRSSYRIYCTRCGQYASEAGETKREALALAKMEGFVRKRV